MKYTLLLVSCLLLISCHKEPAVKINEPPHWHYEKVSDRDEIVNKLNAGWSIQENLGYYVIMKGYW